MRFNSDGYAPVKDTPVPAEQITEAAKQAEPDAVEEAEKVRALAEGQLAFLSADIVLTQKEKKGMDTLPTIT